MGWSAFCGLFGFVAQGVIALPVPGIPAHIRQGLFRLPQQLFLALAGVGIAGGDIAGAALCYPIGHLYLIDLLEGVHHFQHAIALAGGDIDVRIEEAPDYRIIIPALEVIQPDISDEGIAIMGFELGKG